MQKENLNNLYTIENNVVPKRVKRNKNKRQNWEYGYDKKYDIVIISKDGTLGDIYNINGLLIGLPYTPKICYKRNDKSHNQYWTRFSYPKVLERIKSIFQWNEISNTFKQQWVNYIEKEFDRREKGMWFMNNGIPTYITGTHYMYLQWTKIDVGYPDYREANRIFYIFWEACKADSRCFGMCYLKIRRSGS